MNQEMNEELKKALEVYPSFKKMMGGKVKIRTYMHQLFSSIVAEHIENYVDPVGEYPNDIFSSYDEESCRKQISNIAKDLTKVYDKPTAYIKMAIFCAIAYLKCMDWEKEFKQLLPKEEEMNRPECDECKRPCEECELNEKEDRVNADESRDN